MTIPDSLLEAARDAYDNHDDADDACQPEALRAALEAEALAWRAETEAGR